MTFDLYAHEAADADAPLTDLLTGENEQLRSALSSRTVTAQATGLLAGKFDLTLVVAWNVLRNLSMDSNIKLRDVARILLAAQDGAVASDDHESADLIARGLPHALHLATGRTG